MRRRSRSPVAVGAVMLAVLAAALYLGLTKSVPFRQHYEVQAVFASAASQLQKGSPVRIAGVNVGKVTRMERGPGGTAIAVMRIQDGGRPLHSDATMKIRPRLFLEGNFFVDIRPGTAGAPELRDGGTVPLSHTAVPVQVDEVLQVLRSDTRAQLRVLLDEYAQGLSKGGAEALNAGIPSWRGAFAGTAITMESLRGEDRGDLAGFIRNQSRVSHALARRERELSDLLPALNRTTAALADERANVQATVRVTARLFRRAPAGLAELEQALPPVRRLARDLRPALRTAPAVLDRTVPFLREARALSRPAELRGLATELRPALSELRVLQPRLVDLFDRLRPVAACVRDNVLPVLESRLDDDELTTDQPVWQELVRFPVGLASSTQNFTANGNGIRYHAGGGENLLTTRLASGTDLVGLAPDPPIGARPAYVPGEQPPFRPDVPCATQRPPDLRAEAVRMPATQSVEGRPSAVQELTQQLLGTLQDLPPTGRAR
jgi:virulence factor Mce-like protein